jgi:hypothetical protein
MAAIARLRGHVLEPGDELVPDEDLARPGSPAAEPPLIRFGHGFAAEEQVWLMSARPDLTPNQGAKYRLKFISFQGNPERFQAYLANELDGGTAPGLAVIFARAQGVDLKLVAGICQEAAGKEWFTTQYMVKDDGPIKGVKDLKGGTVAVVGIKTATDLWARAAILNAGLVKRMVVTSHDEFAPDRGHLCTGTFHVAIDFAHFNYARGARPYHQVVQTEFEEVRDPCLDLREALYSAPVIALRVAAASRLRGSSTTREACLSLSVVRHHYVPVERRWETREAPLFTFARATFSERPPQV